MSDETVYEVIEVAKKTGKLCKGCNEVTKAIEKGNAKLVVVAKDTTPKEIVMHLPLLSKEKGCQYVEVEKKEELGAAAGLPLGTAAVAVTEAGEAAELLKRLE
ncbi:50S ribosomal protein L7ae [Candidatus Woesearchaeota archaeon]|nr:50S ribosomal protein L7ae [Candidatus Woesearchaeota archaeon]